jgi:hypothetical protein
MARSPHGRYEAALRQVLFTQGLSPEAVEAQVKARIVEQEIAASSPAPVKTSPSPSKTDCTVHNPENQLWSHVRKRGTFVRQLRTWASNHDSSAYFHGSISLYPQGSVPGEVLELGRSVNCLLFDTSSSDPPAKIVIRLYRSKRSCNNVPMSSRKETAGPSGDTSKDRRSRIFNEKYQANPVKQQQHPAPPYHLVVRSGSGWLSARHFFDKRHFSIRAKEAKKAQARALAKAAALGVLQRRAANLLADLTAHVHTAPVNQANVPAAPATSHSLAASSRTDLLTRMSNLRTQIQNSDRRSVRKTQTTESTMAGTESSASAKDVVKISPLFHFFTRLPRELQDEIFYQATGYTGRISIYRANTTRPASSSSEPPITISKLFRISKAINEQMTVHIYRSTNFQFGMTGFTNFLWQIGPINRSHLQNLTFRFGKVSLLHCVRWLAPVPFWELFLPPVVTNPPSLTYFWRCQLRDLMRELTLRTLTIDIRDVPLADVPLLVQVLKSAMGSVQHIRIIDNLGSAKKPIVSTQALHRRFPDFKEVSWRELALRYHADYKHLRWHMRQKLAPYDPTVDVRPILDEWMDLNRAFFDA